uniref:UDP-glucose 4-epimerase n=1 Tax=Ditylum brightwellii TaxID=49249 RepID=A0A7S4SB30_9STRA
MKSMNIFLSIVSLVLSYTGVSAFAASTPAAAAAAQLRTVLVTGGAGYIGSHTCLELLATGKYNVVVIDTLDNSSEESLKRVKELVKLGGGCDDVEGRLHFRNCDIRDEKGLCNVFDEFQDISSCIHFAGLKAVGESVSHPLSYYDCNVGGTTTLLRHLQSRSIPNFVFSSSATVYGDPEFLPLRENARLQATNPYGRTKLFIEEILRDCHASDPEKWNILILRYFNPIGAHPSGKIGEDPQGIPNNLMPFIAQVCVGRREKLSVFGDDYDTPDGTGTCANMCSHENIIYSFMPDFCHVLGVHCYLYYFVLVTQNTKEKRFSFLIKCPFFHAHIHAHKCHSGVRDYIHVVDLAKGHVAALEKLYSNNKLGCEAVNLGTGTGVSVLELVEGMAKATGKPVPYVMAPRRPGDVATVYADPKNAEDMLGWKASLGVKEMCEDTWRWQSLNPFGYNTEEEKVLEQ